MIHLFLCFVLLLSPTRGGVESAKCGGGDPCIYLGKTHDPSWIPYEESKGPKPIPPLTDSWNRSDTSLFIAIASFRDKLCPRTLFNIFTKAEYPSRLFVGVVQQNSPEDGDCFLEYCEMMKSKMGGSDCPYQDNIRMTRVDASEAAGPTWARALGSKLLRDEEFCIALSISLNELFHIGMQMDAHMDMVPKWDVKMMKMWAATENEYGILSTYVTEASELPHLVNDDSKGINGLHEVPHLCMVHFHGNYGYRCTSKYSLLIHVLGSFEIRTQNVLECSLGRS